MKVFSNFVWSVFMFWLVCIKEHLKQTTIWIQEVLLKYFRIYLNRNKTILAHHLWTRLILLNKATFCWKQKTCTVGYFGPYFEIKLKELPFPLKRLNNKFSGLNASILWWVGETDELLWHVHKDSGHFMGGYWREKQKQRRDRLR